MKKVKKPSNLFEKEMQSPHFRKTFKRQYQQFQLEIQLLKALESAGWTYEQFAGKIGTKRSHVSRDLKGGGLKRASLARIEKMAKALNMDFVPLLIPHGKQSKILPELQRIIRAE
ncbi:multiprotein-bridging factor 1 family protein [Elusimicrobiota bacterium]